MNEDRSFGNEETYVLTPWGCLCATLSDYGIDTNNITPAIGEHLVEDFMEAMEKAGHVRKAAESE